MFFEIGDAVTVRQRNPQGALAKSVAVLRAVMSLVDLQPTSL
jgi:hypothetical protein